LQIFDDGVLTDSFGRKVDFKNTIIIMTTNLGSRNIRSGEFGFTKAEPGSDYKIMQKKMIEEARRLFNPEFINRIDDPIVFRSLTREDILKIIDIQLKDVKKNLAHTNTDLIINKMAKEIIFEEGFKPEYGARPLRRAIQTLIEDPIAERLLDGSLIKGRPIEVKVKNKSKQLTFRNHEPRKYIKSVTLKE
jgi:ATP-dependent Clp protease ATP-binding subunit ClpC